MKARALLAAFAALTIFVAGCNSGEISFDQQKAKKDALEKVAKKQEGPNWKPRPQ